MRHGTLSGRNSTSFDITPTSSYIKRKVFFFFSLLINDTGRIMTELLRIEVPVGARVWPDSGNFASRGRTSDKCSGTRHEM
ncbi:unnamed protein product [Allacma fusca]|uniref:Uncharacterized protein n=1 Tax=Allacma fusca TaxID=39272 RepID=A0A8J2P637_9HEXA|nr:unnamed protein product [Allacma fusca]